MRSFRQILAAHSPVLVLDAASTLIQAGWLEPAAPSRWQTSGREAGIGVFAAVEALAVDVNRAGAFVFCEGPGSILGIRTVSMAIRTWCLLQPRPVLAYASVALVAHAIGDADLGVIVDARRDSWHHYQIGRGLRRVPPTELGTSARLAMPEHFRHWAPVPPKTAIVSYALPDLLTRTMDLPLLKPTEAPDAYLAEEPAYVTWTPQIHRAPPPR